MRIRGLIRALHSVRAQVASGIPGDKTGQFRASVQGIVRQVEEICSRNQLTPAHLPEPSRRAYSYLKNLDLDRLPAPAQNAQPPSAAPARVKIRNVVRTRDFYAGYFWRRVCSDDPNAEPLDLLVQELRSQTEAIEECCASYNATPAALQNPSREIFAWLKFLTDGENLRAHMNALGLARKALETLKPHLVPQTEATVELVPTGTVLWRHRRSRQYHLFRVSQGFVHAGPEIWQALFHCALVDKNSITGRPVREYAASEQYHGVLMEMQALVEPHPASRRGHHHDLDASFDRVNAAYFGGAMPRPALVWNRIPTGTKLGHYWKQRDQVMLSITLDDKAVPDWVFDFVMYHELLHKKLGSVFANGRRLSHTPEFRQEELRYSRYHEAERFLVELARKTPGPA